MSPLSISTSNAFATHSQLGVQSLPSSGNCNHLFSQRKNCILLTKLHKKFGVAVKCFAKKMKKDGKLLRNRTKESGRVLSDEYSETGDKASSSNDLSAQSDEIFLNDGVDGKKSVSSTSRTDVLQACTVTSGVILALGISIRQVSHIGFTEGLPIIDCSTEVSFRYEMWHLELIAGLVILISSCRYLLLQIWPDFATSSRAANQKILSSLQPLDYVVVACLPGLSEELLFRGALLPLFGLNWKSALVVGVIFGVLHLGSGRRYSFAIWATFVGFAYGYATILSGSIIVPITSHALNNLIGGILWRYFPTKLEVK